jgi:uncharacterized membrane protein
MSLAARLACAAMTVVAAAAYAGISLYRHAHFGSNAWDLAIQDQTVWGYSTFHVIPNTVEMVPNLLGDHFNPILAVLAPFYRMFDGVAVLLVAQAVLLGVAGIPIFLWAAERVGPAAGLAFQASYLVFWGLLAGVVYDFHHVVFAVPAVSAALYATLTRRDWLLWPMVGVGFLTREDVPLTFAALGLYVALVQRRFLVGAVLTALSGAWTLVAVTVVLPALGGSPYRHWLYGELGSGPLSAAVHVVTRPLSSLRLLFEPTRKVELMAGLIGNWLCLPLVSPLFLVVVPALLERFWASDPNIWSFRFQYSMLEGPILAFCAIDSVARLRAWLGPRAPRLLWPAVVAALAAVSLLASAVAVRPLTELTTYVSAAQAARIQSCLDVIPPDASVAASNFLVPHLSHRRQIYVISVSTDADYLAVDVSTYRRHFAPGEEDQLRQTVRSALAGSYGAVCSRDMTVVLHRGAPEKTLSPPLTAWLDN